MRIKQKDCIFKTTAAEMGKWGITQFFWLLRQQHINHDFYKVYQFVLYWSNKKYVFILDKDTFNKFSARTICTRGDYNEDQRTQDTTFVAAYITAQFICTWNINTKIRYLPPYELYKVYLETTSLVNPRPGLQLIPVQHTFIIMHNTAKQTYHISVEKWLGCCRHFIF